MAAAGVSIVISATDRATDVINRVNARVENVNRVFRPVNVATEQFGRSLSALATNTGLAQVGNGLRTIAERTMAMASSLGRFAPALAGLGGVASIAGVARLTTSWAEFGDQLDRQSRRIGISAERLHSLQGAARLAGVSADALTDGMRTLGDNLVDAVGGRAPEFAAMMTTLGVSFRDARTGGARLAEEVLPEVADRIAAIKNPALQARAAVTIFGGAAEHMLPFLRKGAAGLREYEAAAKAYGVQNAEGAAAARAFSEEQARLGLAIEGVGYSIAQRVAPILLPMLRSLSDWISGNRKEISDFFGDIAKRLEEWVTAGGPAKLRDDIVAVAKRIGEVVDAMGGWKVAAIGLAAVLNASLIAAVSNLLLGVGRLTVAIATGLVGAFGAAATAAEASNARMMKLPFYRLLALGLSVGDAISQGIDPNTMSPEMRGRLGLPPAPAPSEQGSGGPDTRDWWQRNAPAILGGRPPPGQAPAGLPVPPQAAPLGVAETNARTQEAMQYFMSPEGGGYTREQAAGITARLLRESGLNENAVGDGGQARGVAQWHPDRQEAIRRGTGIDVTSAPFRRHLEAITWELQNNERNAGEAVRRARTPAEAADAFTRRYERPGNVDAEATATARHAETLFRTTPVAPPGPPLGGPPAIGLAPLPQLLPPAPTLPLAPSGTTSVEGGVRVNIVHSNPPPGTRTQVTTDGIAEYGGLKIERALPSVGLI